MRVFKFCELVKGVEGKIREGKRRENIRLSSHHPQPKQRPHDPQKISSNSLERN
jgi:hypothetical protein